MGVGVGGAWGNKGKVRKGSVTLRFRCDATPVSRNQNVVG